MISYVFLLMIKTFGPIFSIEYRPKTDQIYIHSIYCTGVLLLSYYQSYAMLRTVFPSLRCLVLVNSQQKFLIWGEFCYVCQQLFSDDIQYTTLHVSILGGCLCFWDCLHLWGYFYICLLHYWRHLHFWGHI